MIRPCWYGYQCVHTGASITQLSLRCLDLTCLFLTNTLWKMPTVLFVQKTNPQDSVESLRKKAKVPFESKHITQVNFQEHFSKTSSVLFSQNQLVNLNTKGAKVIAQILKSIATSPGKAVFTSSGKSEKVLLPRVFGKEPQKRKILPLGYQSLEQPSEKSRCDVPQGRVVGDEQWTLLACSHSYHASCLSQPQCCPLCQDFLKTKHKNYQRQHRMQYSILNLKMKIL